MSLAKIKHRDNRPSAKGRRTATQHQKGHAGWPDYDERENVFFTPTKRPYAEVLTIRSPAAAREAADWMAVEYGIAEKKGDGKWMNHITKAVDNTAKRAELSIQRPNISAAEKAEMHSVASIYKRALASNKFGNYYSARREGAIVVPADLGGTLYAKGELGGSLVKFRMVKYTEKGNRIMAYIPFRDVYRSGNPLQARAKARELRSVGFQTRIIRVGRMRHVYAHASGQGKFKYQPPDVWFDKSLRAKHIQKAVKTEHERTRKASYRARKKHHAATAEKKLEALVKARAAKAKKLARKKARQARKALKQ